MPSLYSGNTISANVSASNTTSLYQGNGPVNVLNSAQSLYLLLSNSGNVQFSLTDANTRVMANAINLNNTGVSAGTYGSDTLIPVFTVQADGRITGVVNTPISGALGNYGNSNVAAFLPTYTGILTPSSVYTNNYLFANGVNILSTITPSSSYGNSNVAAYLPTDSTIIALQSNAGTQQTQINSLISNAATQAGQIQTLDANLGTATTNITALFANAGTQATAINTLTANAATQAISINTLTANAASQQVQIDGLTSNAAIQAVAINTINANLGAFETYANATFGTSNYGNANVAAYLPADPTIIALQSNAASQQTQIDTNTTGLATLNANVGAYETWANATFSVSSYGNANVAAYLPTYTGSLENSSSVINLWANAASQQTQIDSLSSNAAAQAVQIQTLDANLGVTVNHLNTLDANVGLYEQTTNANLGTATNNITTLFANAAAQAGQIAVLDANLGVATNNINTLFANAASQQTQIDTNSSNITTLFANAAIQQTEILNIVATSNANARATLSATSNSGVYTDSTLVYNPATGVFTYNEPTYVQSAFNVEVPVKNTSGSSIPAGTPVYSTGTVGGSDTYRIAPSRADTPTTLPVIGLLKNTLAPNALGYAVQIGQLVGQNTLAYSLNDKLYVAATGGLTNVRPTNGNAVQFLGVVSRINAGNGIITVDIWDEYGLPNIDQGNIWIGPTGGGLPVSSSFATLVSTDPTVTGIQANVGAYETWANTAISNAYFSGNLLGNTLIDSTRYRVFANTFPISAPNFTIGGASNGTTLWSALPVYTNGVLQPATNPTSQTVGFTTSGNVGLRSQYAAANRNTSFTTMYGQVTPVTANVMLNQDRVRAHQHVLEVVGYGQTWGTMNTTTSSASSLVAGHNLVNFTGSGEVNNLVGVTGFIQQIPVNGSANVQYATGVLAGVFPTTVVGNNWTASNIAYARMLAGSISPTGNLTVTNAIGLHITNGWAGTSTNKYALLNEDSGTTISTIGNFAVNSSNGNVWLSTGAGGLIFLDAGQAAGANLYMRGSNITVSTSNTPGVNALNYTGGNVSIIANMAMGASGYVTNFNGNVNYNGVNNTTTIFGNLVTGTTSAYSIFRGTTQMQGNVKFDAPYYETVNNMGNQTGTLTINTGICNTFTMTLTGNVVLNTTSFTNMIAGKSITLIMTQDATGGRYLSSNLLYAGGVSTLSTSANAIDIMNIYYDGSRYLASLVKGYQ